MELIWNLRERQNDYKEIWISYKMLDCVMCAHRVWYVYVPLYFSVHNVWIPLFSKYYKRHWWKCKQPAKKNSVFHNYKKWRSQITLKWKYSHPLNLFSQIPSGLVICLTYFFYTKTTDEVTENCVQYSRFFLLFVWAWYSQKQLWIEDNLEITWGVLSLVINGIIFTKVL